MPFIGLVYFVLEDLLMSHYKQNGGPWNSSLHSTSYKWTSNEPFIILSSCKCKSKIIQIFLAFYIEILFLIDPCFDMKMLYVMGVCSNFADRSTSQYCCCISAYYKLFLKHKHNTFPVAHFWSQNRLKITQIFLNKTINVFIGCLTEGHQH